MGASLPAVARWVEATPQGVSWLGFLYGGNIAGAVFGCLFAGFYLLRVFDMAVATYVGAVINFAVAFGAFALAKNLPYQPAAAGGSESLDPSLEKQPAKHWDVYVTIALSGMCALGAEVIWTRLLSVMIGATVYTFSIILAVFLVGLGLGSGAGSILARSGSRAALGWCQMALAGGDCVGRLLALRFDSLLAHQSAAVQQPVVQFPDRHRALPVGHPAVGDSVGRELPPCPGRGGFVAATIPGRLVGRTYAANTVGAILGSHRPSAWCLFPGSGRRARSGC